MIRQWSTPELYIHLDMHTQCSDAVFKGPEGLEGAEGARWVPGKHTGFWYLFFCLLFCLRSRSEEGSWRMKRITRSIPLPLLKRERRRLQGWRQMIMGATIRLRRFPSLASSLYPTDSLCCLASLCHTKFDSAEAQVSKKYGFVDV
ncbi:uncharacterized protein [Zea mays]|uniref:uncharacterized protein isoform X2 n=1 Tax=Zea mays TaxID=4577 RepID=UPI0004DEA65A|nr:uncharacterized protein LOC103652906 isoform X2 [Zea mays]|eukprot:XP_008678119.1 uncharacterized protein LOC103652906 isoform X2 [Zea mays]